MNIDKIKNNYFKDMELVRDSDYSDQHWKNLMKKKENDLFNIHRLENFRANEISYGLDNSNIRGKEKINYKENTSLLFSKYMKSIHPNILEFVNESLVGNPLTIKQDGYEYSKSSIEFCLMATSLYDVFKDMKYIIEIGGGYGGLSRIIKSLFPEITIILVDLPESNVISSFYLSQVFPKAHIEFGTSNLVVGGGADIFIISPHEMGKISKKSIDLIINTRSMMEMNYTTLLFYFKHFERLIKTDGHLYLLNRYQKLTFLKHYPFGLNWEIILSEIWPKDIDTNLHHELLLKKSNSKNIAFKRLLSSFPPNGYQNIKHYIKSKLVYKELITSYRGNIA
jgi:hypothetical protein